MWWIKESEILLFRSDPTASIISGVRSAHDRVCFYKKNLLLHLVYWNSMWSLQRQKLPSKQLSILGFKPVHPKFGCGGNLQRHIKSLLAIRKKWGISPDSRIQIERCGADLYIAKIGQHLESADFNGVFVKFGPSFDLQGFAPRECLSQLPTLPLWIYHFRRTHQVWKIISFIIMYYGFETLVSISHLYVKWRN